MTKIEAKKVAKTAKEYIDGSITAEEAMARVVAVLAREPKNSTPQ